MKKIRYKIEDYKHDISRIVDYIGKDAKNLHFVCIYRGSLMLGAHLSNIYDAPLSILGYQTYQNKVKEETDKQPFWMHKAVNDVSKRVIILDDIYDSGDTLNKARNFIWAGCPNCKVSSITLHRNNKANDNQGWNHSLRKTNGKWVEYFWETV